MDAQGRPFDCRRLSYMYKFVNATTSTKSKMIASLSLENQQEGSITGQTNYEVIRNMSASHTSGPSAAAGPSSPRLGCPLQ